MLGNPRTQRGDRNIWLLLACIVASLVLPISANTVWAAPSCTDICYVSLSGDDNNSGSASEPLATINAAINQVDVGGTVMIGAGTFYQTISPNKAVTIIGAGRTQTILQASAAGSGIGINLNNVAGGVLIRDLGIHDFEHGIRRHTTTPFSGLTVTYVDLFDNVSSGISFGSTGSASNIEIDNVFANNNGTSASGLGRGFFMQSMYKENIIVRDSTFLGSRISGIDLNDGPNNLPAVKGFQITGNIVQGFATSGKTTDSGIAVLRASSVPTYTNQISGNLVMVYGRFGIEVKGSEDVEVSDNEIVHLAPGAPLNGNATSEGRDLAGIAIGNINNANEPRNITVFGNTIKQFQQASSNTNGSTSSHVSSGFGISASGNGIVIVNNTIEDSDIAINLQQGFSGTQNDLDDLYFGRDTSTQTCAYLHNNTINNALIETQYLGGANQARASNLDTGEVFCSVQSAIADPDTLNGHTILLGLVSPSDSNTIYGVGTISETVVITKELTLRGVPDTIITAPTSSSNSKIFEIRANNVTIENMNIVINQPYAAAGIFAVDPNPFDNALIQNNIITTTGQGAQLIAPNSNSSPTNASAITLLGTNNTIEHALIQGNTISGDETALEIYGRAVWLLRMNADVISNTIDSALAADISYQTPSASSSNSSITIEHNSLLSTGLYLVQPINSAQIQVANNIFDQSVMHLPASVDFQPPHAIVVRNNTNSSINIENNEFHKHILGVLSGASRNVSVIDNQFWPAPNVAEYSHIQVDTAYETGGTSNTIADNGILIQGNHFYGDNTSHGRALDFQNNNATGTPAGTSGYGDIIVGGSGTNQANHFYSTLSQFVRFTDNIQAPSPVQASANGIDPAAFSADVLGTYNIYELANTAPSGVQGLDLTHAQYDEIAALIEDKIDNNALGRYILLNGVLEQQADTLEYALFPNQISSSRNITTTNSFIDSPSIDITIDSPSWLNCTPNNGTIGAQNNQLSHCVANSSGLASGSYTDTVTISSTTDLVIPSGFTLPVTLTVWQLPELAINNSTFVFNATEGDTSSLPNSQNITISNITPQADSGGASLIWGISNSLPSWLNCSSTPNILLAEQAGTLSCSANPSGLSTDTYSATISLQASSASGPVTNSNQDITVYLIIGPSASISIDTNNLAFSATAGDSSTISQTLTITHTGIASSPDISWHLDQLPSWLVCDAGNLLYSGQSATISCSALPGSLAAGTYTSTISLVASAFDNSIVVNSPISINVSLSLAPQAELYLAENSLSFVATEGDSASTPGSASIEISNIGLSGSSDLIWSISNSLAPWLSCNTTNSQLASGSSGSIECSADPSGLATGIYTDTIMVSASASDGSVLLNANQSIQVELRINAPAPPVYQQYLSLIAHNAIGHKPDLVGDFRIIGLDNNTKAGDPVVIQISITNQGTQTAAPFWVDFYINPRTTPSINTMWHELCALDPCFGLGLGVQQTLAPGQSITLSSQVLDPDYSHWVGWLAKGTNTFVLQIDSYGDNSYGNIDELNELNNLVIKTIDPITGTNPALPIKQNRIAAR